MLSQGIHSVSSTRPPQDHVFLTGDTETINADIVTGKNSLSLIVYYGETIAKVTQFPISGDTLLTEILKDQISLLREHTHLRATLMFSCSEGALLFEYGDLVYLSRYLRSSEMLRRFSLGIDFAGVNESDSTSVALLVLRIRQLGFQIYSNSTLGREIVNNLIERFALPDEILTAISDLEARQFYESLL